MSTKDILDEMQPNLMIGLSKSQIDELICLLDTFRKLGYDECANNFPCISCEATYDYRT